jgi:chlorophyllase
MDFLDDHTDGLLGKLSYCICRNGPSRRLMRRVSGGILVAFCRATFFSDIVALENLIRNPRLAPAKLEAPQWYTPTASTTSECPDLELVFSRVGSTSKLRA